MYVEPFLLLVVFYLFRNLAVPPVNNSCKYHEDYKYANVNIYVLLFSRGVRVHSG